MVSDIVITILCWHYGSLYRGMTINRHEWILVAMLDMDVAMRHAAT